jgi:hypothetical protein
MVLRRLKSFDQTARFSQPKTTLSLGDVRFVRGQCPRALISAGT